MEINLANWITPLLSIGLRVSGLMLFAPVFGSSALPGRVKAILVIALTALLYPALSVQVRTVVLSPWPLVVLHESLIGVAIGVAANLVFEAMQLAGQILSIQMGLSLASILDPQTQAESTVIALFHHTVTVLIFLGLNVHLALLQVVAQSFDWLPFGAFALCPGMIATTLTMGGVVFSLGVRIAAPTLAATLVTDVVIGLLGRASPQMPLLLLGPAVKSILGAAVLFAVVADWPALLTARFADSLAHLQHLLQVAR